MLGNVLLAAPPAAKSGGFNPSTLILILVVVVAFYMLMIRPQRRRQQQAKEKQGSVQPGARVRTTAGMYATVVDVDGDDVILEVAPGIEVRYMKRAIMDVVSPADEDEADPSNTEDLTDEHVGNDEDDEPQDTVGNTDTASSDDAEESAYEQATGTKKD